MVARRVLWAVALLFLVSVAVFVMIALIPGNAAITILGQNATPGAIAALNKSLGLTKPLYLQYIVWAGHALTGRLGYDVFDGQAVVSALDARLPATISLVACTIVVVAGVGVVLGVLGAIYEGIIGRVIDWLSVIGFAVPNFWLATLLIVAFAVSLRLLPSIGYVGIASSVLGWLAHMVLPVIALSLGGVAFIARLTKAEVAQVLRQDYVGVMLANGIAWPRILVRHVLRNAGVPILGGISISFIALLSGTILIEQIFGIPGIGSLAITATNDHDVPVVEGVAVYFTLIVVVVNMVVELLYVALNPKVRRHGE